METPSDCGYQPDLQVCLRPDCPKCCNRNYRDQMASDLPVDAPHARPKPVHKREVRLMRWLSRLVR